MQQPMHSLRTAIIFFSPDQLRTVSPEEVTTDRNVATLWLSESSWLLNFNYLCIPQQSLTALMNLTVLHPLLYSISLH